MAVPRFDPFVAGSTRSWPRFEPFVARFEPFVAGSTRSSPGFCLVAAGAGSLCSP
jgi:hypothetical protein